MYAALPRAPYGCLFASFPAASTSYSLLSPCPLRGLVRGPGAETLRGDISAPGPWEGRAWGQYPGGCRPSPVAATRAMANNHVAADNTTPATIAVATIKACPQALDPRATQDISHDGLWGQIGMAR